MVFPFVRSIEFIIPALGKSPEVLVKATEVEGDLLFEVNVLKTRQGQPEDLRGLYFNLNARDDLDLSSLQVVEGEDVTDYQVPEAINFKNGNNLKGKVSQFDVGVNFGSAGVGKDKIEKTGFTLTASSELTLDDIALVDFGARINGSKLTVQAPAAPDAVDDEYFIFEDGAAGLDAPSSEPAGTVFSVLDNDSDADGDTLTIVDIATGAFGPQHGTVEIIDGDDDDELIGDAVRYTPFEDFSGTDSFYYRVDDGNGATDYAQVTVNIEAVADVPTVGYEVVSTELINQFILRVTATETDADHSEYIDRIELLATLPDDSILDLSSYVDSAIYNPGSQNTSESHNFLITLPKNVDSSFDLSILTTSKETSNGDEQTDVQTLEVDYDVTSNSFQQTFGARDQSIWAEGDAFSINKSFDLGSGQRELEGTIAIDPPYIDTRVAGVGMTSDWYFGLSGDVDFSASLTSKFSLHNGTVNADIKYDGNISSFFNHTTDSLLFETSAIADLANSSFSASTPKITFEELLSFSASGDITLTGAGYIQAHTGGSSHDIFNQQPFADQTVSLPNLTVNDLSLVRFDGSNLHLLNGLYTKSEIKGEKKDALQNTMLEWELSIPQFDTISRYDAGKSALVGSGKDKFVQLSYDLDGIVAHFLGKVNPMDLSVTFGNDQGSVTGGATLLDYDLVNPFSFGQDYQLKSQGLKGKIILEDATEREFTFGDSLLFTDASQHDANKDGLVEYSLLLDPDSRFTTDTKLITNMYDEIEFFKPYLSASFGPIGGTTSTGPLYTLNGPLPDQEFAFNVYSSTFDLDFASNTSDLFYA